MRPPPVNISSDDRRLGFFNIFGEATPGQVNVVRLRLGAVCAWHRHTKQTDHYFCVSGAVKVGMVDAQDTVSWFVLDERNPATVTVLPGTWHGYTALSHDAVLLQYLDQKYDASDEERTTVEDMGVSWQTTPR